MCSRGGCMTKNYEGREMAGIGSLKAAGVVALSDDGRAFRIHSLMRHVVEYAKSFNLPILDHCEEKTLAADGVMNEGKWSVLLGMNGISGASEELMVRPQHHPRPPDRLEDPYAACQRQGERGAAPQRPGRRGFRSPAKRRRTT